MPRQVEQVIDGDGALITTTLRPPSITVSYSRKINLGNYESADAFCSVQADVDLSATDEDKSAAIRSAFLLARSACCEQMGIKFTVDEGLVIKEAIERIMGPTEIVRPATPNGSTTSKGTKAEAWRDLQENPQDWWDNRENKLSPKSPDFSRSGDKQGLWLTYNGQSVVPKEITIPEPSAFRAKASKPF